MHGYGLPRLALSCALLLAASSAARSAGEYGEPLGDLRLSFDPAGQTREIRVATNEVFSWYVLADVDFGDPTTNGRDGILVWEALVDASPEIYIMSREVFGDPLTCGSGSCGDDWQVYLSRCFIADEGPSRLVRYTGRLLAPASDLEVRLQPATESNFDGTAPGWAACSSHGAPEEDLHPFASGWSSSLIINNSVAVDDSSWSALKARF